LAAVAHIKETFREAPLTTLRTMLPGTGYGPHSDAHPEPRGPEPRKDRPDDDSSRSHRQIIGMVGLALPVLLPLITWALPNDAATGLHAENSISGYFYTSAVFAFVGLLIALALYLFAYRGYANEWQKWDRRVAITAGIAAMLVAAIPTTAPSPAQRLLYWKDWFVDVHYGAAALLFTMFAVFSLYLFTRQDPSSPKAEDKSWRNKSYYALGALIVVGMVWAFVAGRQGKPIFAAESLSLVSFAASWLLKGSIHKTVHERLHKAPPG